MKISLDIFHFVKNSGATILCKLKRINIMILENPLFHNDDLYNLYKGFSGTFTVPGETQGFIVIYIMSTENPILC